MKENWANRLQERMDGFEQPVNEALWSGIARNAAPARKRWWPWIPAAVAFAAAAIALVVFMRKEPVAEPIGLSPEGVVAAVEDAPRTEDPAGEILPATPLPLKLGDIVADAVTLEDRIVKDDAVEDIVDSEPVVREEAVARNDTVVKEPSSNEDWMDLFSNESKVRQRRLNISTLFYAQTSPLRNRYFSGSVTENNDPHHRAHPGVPDDPPGPDTGTPVPGIPDPGIMDPGTPDSWSDSSGGLPPPEDEDTKALDGQVQQVSAPSSPEWNHAFPVQIGARVSFSWSRRWSVETGLTFLHFNSWNATRQQRMEYLGVPLYVDFLFEDIRNIAFYASAGGQAFKCVAGNAPDKPWLFSAGLGLGVEYNISPLISLYAEPGVDWYFGTGESRHYYTENPFACSLSLGVRFHFQ